jgi:hypothetical protein
MTIYDYSALSVLIVLVMSRAMPMFARWKSINASHIAEVNRERSP